MRHGHYALLAVMGAVHFFAMYGLMYAMVNVLGNVLPNSNQLYMAGLMTAPMLALEPILMRSMYPNRIVNVAIVLGSVVLLIGSFVLIRQQAAVTDRQFLRSMIPHHGGAILMCEQAPIRDPEIAELCEGIIESQQSEIDWMKHKLAALEQR